MCFNMPEGVPWVKVHGSMGQRNGPFAVLIHIMASGCTRTLLSVLSCTSSCERKSVQYDVFCLFDALRNEEAPGLFRRLFHHSRQGGLFGRRPTKALYGEDRHGTRSSWVALVASPVASLEP